MFPHRYSKGQNGGGEVLKGSMGKIESSIDSYNSDAADGKNSHH